jgi:anaerobic selenocysteine-containing dehydrogenase
MCGLVVETEGDRVTSIRGDEADPFSRGHICPKAVALQDVHEDPDRLRHPVKRIGDSWQKISWREAYALVEQGLKQVQRAHGRDAVAIYVGNPTVHSFGASVFAPRFMKSLRTKNRYSATSVDQLPHHLAALWMFGHPLLIPIPDLDRTEHLLVIGANPVVSNGSLMTAPDVAMRLKDIKVRGGRIVVIDPRRNETAELAGEHHFIRPGTDASLLLALLHVMFAEGLTRAGTTGAFSTGVDDVRAIAAQWPPERVAAVTGIAAGDIRTIARDFARAERAVAYGRIGVSTQEFGALACWLISVLNAVTGRLDAPGGAMFTRPALNVLRSGGTYGGAGRFGRWKSRVRGLPEFAGELPVTALAEEIETPGDGQIHALVTHAGNPVLSTPNGARLDRALSGLEFYAAIDFYVNETTRHAHVILPPVSPLERDHYDAVFHALAIRNTAKYSPPLFAKAADARFDWEILTELTARMTGGGFRKRLMARAEWAAVKWLGTRGVLDRELKRGPYASQGMSVATLEANPHGVDLGALEPMLPKALRTPDKLVHLAPSEVVGDVQRLAVMVDAGAPSRQNGALSLIGRRELRTNNSWMHNSERLVRGKRRCTLLMHPADATMRGLSDGDRVAVQSRTGRVDVEVETTDAMMPGVVSLPHGWGHGRAGVRLRVAQAHAGVSINDLTDESKIDALSGNAAFCGVQVQVERATA